MAKFEYIAPAVQRLRDLCTNGLFLNLREFPEPLKTSYQHLRDQIRDTGLGGAALALVDMANVSLRFPVLLACARVLASDTPHQAKQQVFAHFNDTPALVDALKDFFAQYPDELAQLFVATSEDAVAIFSENGFWTWAHRINSGCFLELSRPEAASELITQLGVLNGYLKLVLRFYPHLKEVQDEDTFSYDCFGNQLIPAPFVFYHEEQLYLAERYDPDCDQFVCRNYNTLEVRLFDGPLKDFVVEHAPSGDTSLAQQLSPAYQVSDYLRPAYLDRWLHQALFERANGYLLLETETGMGKSIYTSMLDPLSPYYMEGTLFQDVHIRRYSISLYPDSQRPSCFVQTLNRLFPDVPPILFTHECPDLRRRIAEFLNAAARQIAPKKLLLILDGMHQLDYTGQNAFSLPEILPQASQLSPNVYILLTDQCQEEDLSHRNWLAKKDSLAYIGSFTREYAQHQQLFRGYLAQYVLHSTEDNPLVETLGTLLKGDLSLAHTLRDVFALCRPDAGTNLVHFFEEYPSQKELLDLYMERLYELYGPVYSRFIDQLLQFLALAPHASSVQDLRNMLVDMPSDVILWPLLRDLRPYLTFYDLDTLGLATTKIHYLALAAYSPAWRDYCVRLTSQRRDQLTNTAEPFCQLQWLTDLDYYAKSVGWEGHEALLTDIARPLVPAADRTEELPQAVVDYYMALGDFFPDETTNPFRLETLSVLALSPVLSDRRLACNRWDSLQNTPQFDADSYAASCRLYAERLSAHNPLNASTIEALASFRRKSEALYDYAFVWHTEKLHRSRLAEALLNPAAFDQTNDPCNINWVCQRLPQLIQLAEDDLLNPLPQECGVLTHLLVPFCETYLRALLPILCGKDALAPAGEMFEFIRKHLLQIYRCRTRLFAVIQEYSALLITDVSYNEGLYGPDSMEAQRLEHLPVNLHQWLQTFTERQQLQFFRDGTEMWRTYEALLRLESLHALPAKEYGINPRTIRGQIVALDDPAQALELADRWYKYTCATLASGRGAIPVSKAADLCTVLLVRAELLCQLKRTKELHTVVAQLRFFLDHGELSSKRLLEVICALGTQLLAADTLSSYSSPQTLVAFYSHLNNRLEKSQSFLTGRQIAAIQSQLKDNFPRCMIAQHFYGYLIPAQAKIDSVDQGPEACRRRIAATADPVEKLIAYQTYVICSSNKNEPRRAYLTWLMEYITHHVGSMPAPLLDYCISQALELRQHCPEISCSFSPVLYTLWQNHASQELALLGLDGQTPSQQKLLYRRLSGCFLTEGAQIDLETLRQSVFAQDEEPLYRGFDLLCLAIAVGSRSIAAARKLSKMGFEALEDITVEKLPLALELTKVQLLALCLDDAACLDPLPELASRWIDLQWGCTIAAENHLPADSQIIRTDDGRFTALPPVALQISNQILENCIGSDAVVSTNLAFRTYAKLWNCQLAYPVPENLAELLHHRLMENWEKLG